MVYLVTGATGFVGRYFVDFLLNKDPNNIVIGLGRKPSVDYSHQQFIFEQIDLNHKEQISRVILKHKPNFIAHLAAESSVSFSWKNPIISFNNNVNIFLNLIEAVRLTNTKCRILSVGSSECYGIVDQASLPLNEEHKLNPVSPYAVARVAQELLSKVYVDGFKLDIIMTRSFNHIGPTQDTRFVIPSFINQVIDRKKSDSVEPIHTGDLSIVRDFLDVRDVIKAYDLLFENGISGEIYNICSGNGYSLQDILLSICELLDYSVDTVLNPGFLRPNDNPRIVGDNSKIFNITKWQSNITMKEALNDIIKYQLTT